MKKKVSLSVTISLIVLTVAITFSLTMFGSMRLYNSLVRDVSQRTGINDALSEIDQIVRENYFGTVDNNTLNSAIAKGYVEGLGDKHSYYLSAKEYGEMSERLRGKTHGFGVDTVYDSKTKTFLLVHVYENSPAKSAGLQKNDRILAVDDQNLSESTYEKAKELLQGEDGTKVRLRVQRGKEQLTIAVTRGSYETQSVFYEIIQNVGYVQITTFNELTVSQFNEAMDALLAKNVVGFVFDVRGNGGGSLDSVSQMIDRLVPTGTIVSAQYKDGTTKALKTSDSNSISKPMVVLINGDTASAAELFACDLRDYGKAQLVGVKSYGKGTMQQVFTLSDGSAVNLTIAKFLPYKSESFDEVGLQPDFAVALSKEEQENFYSLTETTDPQLKKALSLLTSQGA